jgi:hypothetical protein
LPWSQEVRGFPAIERQVFAERLSSRPAVARADGVATLIVDTRRPLVQQGTLAISPRDYVVKRGRGRLIVEPARR